MNRTYKSLVYVFSLFLPILHAYCQTDERSAPAANAQGTKTTFDPTSQQPFVLGMRHSRNPFSIYIGNTVPEPNLINTPRISDLIHDGKLFVSLTDAISLALENNLDLAIARYNLPIAETDILRTRAGGTTRGVNTGVVSGTPGGGQGGFGTGAPGAGAGGTTGGAGGAGAGASGLVQSTLGTGSLVSSFDPILTGQTYLDHTSQLLTNRSLLGVSQYRLNTILSDVTFSQALPTGTSLELDFNNNRTTTNSPNVSVNPQLNTFVRGLLQQQLLAGFGFGPNLRYLHIAQNNKKISDVAFEAQVISTVTQVKNIYWDLVNAFNDERVKERSLTFAQQTFLDNKKKLDLKAIAALDVTKSEAEVANREQDLTIARTTLQLQELLLKNALTKTLDDTVLEEMPVVPTDQSKTNIGGTEIEPPVSELIATSLVQRTELRESTIDLKNRALSRKTARNALLPTLALYGFYSGNGFAGEPNTANQAQQGNATNIASGYGGAFANAFNNTSPEYQVGLSMQIPLRNRIARADQYRTELEYRQSELYFEELRKRIRIEVRNAHYALLQTIARVSSAQKARDLADKLFEIVKKEQTFGAGSNSQTLAAEHDLSLAESALTAAQTDHEKARIELDRVTGQTLMHSGIDIEAARSGVIAASKSEDRSSLHLQ